MKTEPVYFNDLARRLVTKIHGVRINDMHKRSSHHRLHSYTKIAERVGKPRSCVESYLRGHRQMSLEILDRFLFAMGWTVMDLLTSPEREKTESLINTPQVIDNTCENPIDNLS